MKNLEKSRLYGDFLLLIVAIIWGGGFVAGKFAMDTLSPMAVLMYRFIMSSIAIGIPFHRSIARATWKEVKWGAILGVVFLLALFIQLTALQYTTSSKQAFIASSYIMFTPLISWAFFKSKPAITDLIAAVLMLTGVGFIGLNRAENFQIGDFITLGFAVVFALQIILISRYTKDLSAANITFFQFATAAVVAAIIVLVAGVPARIGSVETFGGIAYLALVNTAFATGLQNYAQKFADENHASLILSLESVFGFLSAIIIFRDPITLKILLGGILCLAGVIVSKLKPKEI